MAATPIFGWKADLQDGALWFPAQWTGAVSTTKQRSGTHSFRFSGTARGRRNVSTQSQIQFCYHVNHNGKGSTNVFFNRFLTGTTEVGGVYWNGTTNNLELQINGVALVTAPIGNLSDVDSWKFFAGSLYLHASTGYFTLYVDGSVFATFTGNTAAGGTTFDTVEVGAKGTANQWNAYIYYDSLYLATATQDESPTDRRFAVLFPNANGTYSQMTGSDGDQVDNYLLADEWSAGANDGDTTYVKALANDLTDTYNLGAVTLLPGYSVAAAWPVAAARKVNAGDDTQVQLTTYSGTTLTKQAAQSLSTDYAMYINRLTTDPNTGVAWTEAGINALEAGVTATGTF